MTRKEFYKWRTAWRTVNRKTNKLCRFYYAKFDKYYGKTKHYGHLHAALDGTDAEFETYLNSLGL